MIRYKYTGQEEVSVPGVGVFKPGEEKDSEIVINNPDFIEVKSKSQEKREEIQKGK